MKSKKDRQLWWRNLTPGQQSEYLESRAVSKAQKRRTREKRDTQRFALKYDCSKCILGISRSCVEKTKNGCGYYDDGKTQGIYYTSKVHYNN
jgi:hypothetical protein